MALNSSCRSCGTRLCPEDNDGPITQPEKCARCRVKPVNGFAIAGRQQKALAMVCVIDANFHRQFPNLDCFDQAARIRLASFTWSDDQWESIGTCARKPNGEHYDHKAISSETRDMVRNIYAGRAQAPLANRRAS